MSNNDSNNNNTNEGKEVLKEKTKEMFENVQKYLQNDLTANSNDFQLLEEMNKLAASKYETMSDSTEDLIKIMEILQKKYESYYPYLEKIEKIHSSINEFEKVVAMLDDYSGRLEEKFTHLEYLKKGYGVNTTPTSPIDGKSPNATVNTPPTTNNEMNKEIQKQIEQTKGKVEEKDLIEKRTKEGGEEK